MAEFQEFEPSLQNIISNPSLKWIFVGGKSGVGKTTVSVSLAMQLAKVKQSVLLISIDSGNNISDVFGQKFTKGPVLINGFDNLFSMETDMEANAYRLFIENFEGDPDDTDLDKRLKDAIFGIPGIDELANFFETMKLVNDLNFSVVVFDTAPTEHTVRLLSFPQIMDKYFTKVSMVLPVLSPIACQFLILFGVSDFSSAQFTEEYQALLMRTKQINQQLRNPEHTTFVSVCNATFLPLYETERIVQELGKHKIDIHNIVINHVLHEEKNVNPCTSCSKKYKEQEKYLGDIYELYENFHITKIPMLHGDLSDTERITALSEHLITPYKF